VVKNWGTLPDGRMWGNTAGVDIAPDGNIWTYDRCGTNSCLVDGKPSPMNSVFKFNRNTGQVMAQFGGGRLIFPHGIHVDREGNVWITDGNDNAAPRTQALVPGRARRAALRHWRRRGCRGRARSGSGRCSGCGRRPGVVHPESGGNAWPSGLQVQSHGAAADDHRQTGRRHRRRVLLSAERRHHERCR
jgi:DNA-binding beta-propeller fold protein YncE